MTDIRFDTESFVSAQKNTGSVEGFSELLEQESRRYSRELSQEREARTK